MVKFGSVKIKQQVMAAKKKLKQKDSPVYISDHLTTAVSELFARARTLVREKKIAASWTYNGRLFIKKSHEASARPIMIRTMEELSR